MVVLVLYCPTIKWRSTILRVGSESAWRSGGAKVVQVQHYGRLTAMRHCPGPRHAQVAMHNTMAVNRWTILAAGDIDHVKKSRIQKGRRSVLGSLVDSCQNFRTQQNKKISDKSV